MSKYYYLVAGLPELTLEDSKLSYTVADFKTEIYTGLSVRRLPVFGRYFFRGLSLSGRRRIPYQEKRGP